MTKPAGISACGNQITTAVHIDSLTLEGLKRSLSEGVQQCIKGKDVLLRNAVVKFLDAFPKLTVWERIKDFFGLSDTAENRRNMTTLYITGMVQHYRNKLSHADYDLVSRSLCRMLGETELTKGPTPDRIEMLTATAVARLLTQESDAADHICLTDTKIAVDPLTGNLMMNGKVSFGSYAEDDPPLPSKQSYRIQISTENSLLEKLGGINNTSDHTSLIAHLSPEDQLKAWMLRTQAVFLFSRGGLLSGTGRYTEGNFQQTARTVNDVKTIALNCKNPLNKNFSPDRPIVVRMVDGIWENNVTDSKETGLLFDLSRAGLHRDMDIWINGNKISAKTMQSMHEDTVSAASNRSGLHQQLLENLGDSWANKIQRDLKLPPDTCRQAVAALMYTFYQGGAGWGYTGLLAQLGPRRNSGEEVSHSVMHIDTAQNKGDISVTQAMFSTGTWSRFGKNSPSFSDYRAGGVKFRLHFSENTSAEENTPAQMAAGFIKGKIPVEGLGVRCPVAPFGSGKRRALIVRNL